MWPAMPLLLPSLPHLTSSQELDLGIIPQASSMTQIFDIWWWCIWPYTSLISFNIFDIWPSSIYLMLCLYSLMMVSDGLLCQISFHLDQQWPAFLCCPTVELRCCWHLAVVHKVAGEIWKMDMGQRQHSTLQLLYPSRLVISSKRNIWNITT